MTWMPSLPNEKTANWAKTPPGPRGPRRGVAGFTEVKQAAAQDMADDAGLRRMPAMPGMTIGGAEEPPISIQPVGPRMPGLRGGGGRRGGGRRGGGRMRGKY